MLSDIKNISQIAVIPLPVYGLFVLNVVCKLNVGVAVTEPCDIGHLRLGQLQNGIPLLVFHLHDVKDRLVTLNTYFTSKLHIMKSLFRKFSSIKICLL